MNDPVAEGPGTVIGPYKLLEQIGEGGFCAVFTAEQIVPVRRMVAVKILKPRTDSPIVIARFEAERQALAIMDHPNIVKVLDAGTTKMGRPYFVMEMIKGVPVTDFCGKYHLAPRERLELFLQLCQAVQHVHQNSIVHRDLKPSDILVTLDQATCPLPLKGKGSVRELVKLIDFGVAKALRPKLSDKTLFIGFVPMIGTPPYMSPEQAAKSPDVDLRSDIYSLGVLLFELLTGTTPFAKERFKHATDDEIRRIIGEEKPPKPSKQLSELKDSSSISVEPHLEPAKLTMKVVGELDWIVMKCLEKDPCHRYETADSLRRDIGHCLNDGRTKGSV